MLLCGLRWKTPGHRADWQWWCHLAYASGNWLLKNDITGSGALVKQGRVIWLLIMSWLIPVIPRLKWRSDCRWWFSHPCRWCDVVGSKNIHVLNGGTLSGLGTVSVRLITREHWHHWMLSQVMKRRGEQFYGWFTDQYRRHSSGGGKTGNTLTVNGDYTGGGTLLSIPCWGMILLPLTNWLSREHLRWYRRGGE